MPVESSGFMSKYGSVENRPISRNPLAIERNKLNFDPLGLRERESVRATSVTLVNGQVGSHMSQAEYQGP